MQLVVIKANLQSKHIFGRMSGFFTAAPSAMELERQPWSGNPALWGGAAHLQVVSALLQVAAPR